VFEQHEGVADTPGVAGIDKFLLEVERGCVLDASKMDEIEDHSLGPGGCDLEPLWNHDIP
jgi:hypothetical protein